MIHMYLQKNSTTKVLYDSVMSACMTGVSITKEVHKLGKC